MKGKIIFIIAALLVVCSCQKKRMTACEYTEMWLNQYWRLMERFNFNESGFLEINCRNTDGRVVCFRIFDDLNNEIILRGDTFRHWHRNNTNWPPIGPFYREHRWFSLLFTNSVF